MAFSLGKNAGNLGVLAGGLAALVGGPFSLLAAPALFKMFQDDQDEQQQTDERKYAGNALMTGVLPAGLDPETGITWNQGRSVDPSEQLGLAAQAAPGEVMKARLSQMFPSPKDAKDRFLGTPGEGGVYDIENNSIVEGTRVPRAPEMGGLVRLVGPGGKVMTVNEKSPEAQRMIQSGWNKEGSTEGGGGYRDLTPAEVQARNYDPSGTYQVDNKGKVYVVTQPKQNNPTEDQSKTAFMADRVADALGTVKGVLKDDPTAVSNWLLNSTSGIPGAETIGKSFANPNAQIVRNNLGDAMDAIITLGTGAAYTGAQAEAARNSYLPQPGEPDAVKQDKFRKFQSTYSAARERARAAGKNLPDASEFDGIFGQKSQAPVQPDTSKLPPGSRPLPDGRYQLPDGRKVRWVP